MKNQHEIRDPVHGFVCYSDKERDVINSRPFQRLRHIRQLAMSSYVYPGATHSRFEHSLGVMELATRIFDSIFDSAKLTDMVKQILPEILNDGELRYYWRTVVRMAALTHDLGHLPFSHGAEVLLPQGMTHEKLSWDIIHSDEMSPLWDGLHIKPEHIAKIALGQKEIQELKLGVTLSTWENILAEIIVGNMFGADRMDYLLRDSLHAGVAYGRFDHERLVSTLRILSKPPEGEDQGVEPAIGVERGGLHAAAGLIWARYSMFSQVYFHHTRRSYDMHLIEVMKALFEEGFPTEVDKFLELTDNDIIVYLRKAAYDASLAGHEDAKCIERREHFRRACWVTSEERKATVGKALDLLYDAGVKKWGAQKIRKCKAHKGTGTIDFPVMQDDDESRTASALAMLPLLNNFPPAEAEFIFVEPKIAPQAEQWFRENRPNIFDGHLLHVI
ncbi:MAG: HD domain-containing protein [Deltaproteobacteria bacterium]|nr:HD domain-containing protein [Deltaproteobacteria bacterium]